MAGNLDESSELITPTTELRRLCKSKSGGGARRVNQAPVRLKERSADRFQEALTVVIVFESVSQRLEVES